MTSTPTAKGTAPDIGEYQSQLWRAADTLRGSIDAAEYKHVVLPLIFLKYISDAFEELHEELESKVRRGNGPGGAGLLHRQQCLLGPQGSPLVNYPVPGEAADQRGHHRPGYDRHREGQFQSSGESYRRTMGGTPWTNRGSERSSTWSATSRLAAPMPRPPTSWGRVYEYFLEQFAMAEGRKGGEFYTPRSVVQLAGSNDRALPGPGL